MTSLGRLAALEAFDLGSRYQSSRVEFGRIGRFRSQPAALNPAVDGRQMNVQFFGYLLRRQHLLGQSQHLQLPESVASVACVASLADFAQPDALDFWCETCDNCEQCETREGSGMADEREQKSVDWWVRSGHTDAWHPSSRNECKQCQEMIAFYGPMPPIDEILKREEELNREWRRGRYQKRPIPEGLRWQVFERDDFRCRRCGSRKWLRADHIIPESKSGPMTLDNLQTLCRRCNSSKGARV